ncbi:MAG: glycosyltransferase family 2 protein [Candidatus Thermoplasmatota archaeon]|nr:hypothetical protein [Euryarchaeota archaeon]MED5350862.1 glycosyltransferase family 2 protein [Candidatus Thermoplasmatota archaeon]
MQRLTVMLPTLNEFHALESVVKRIPLNKLKSQGFETQIVVIDGGSIDGTVELAMDLGCHLIEQSGDGKGAGIRQGFQYFLEENRDFLVMLDADGTYDAKEIPDLLEKLNHHDVVIGNRLNHRLDSKAMTRLNWVGNYLLTWLAVALYGIDIRDLCSGYWAFSRDAIEKLQLNSMRFEIEAEMYTSAVFRDLSIGEVDVAYHPRIGEAKLGSVKDGSSIARKLLVRKIFPVPFEELSSDV